MTRFAVDGIVPIIPTPFTLNDEVDFDALRRVLAFAAGCGAGAICLPAYASEFYKLRESERRAIAETAIDFLDGRIRVVAQVNHVSASYVAETARELERAGATAISVAVPRLFGLPERDLLRYFDRILKNITVPLIIQDFNPGGNSVSLDFVQRLHAEHAHFRYLKLEEPLMAARVRSIVEGTHGEVGVIDGWGGVYMLELIEAGICGVMPGLAVADILHLSWTSAKAGDRDTAYRFFQVVLPQIIFSLQNLEFFHHAEKSLLVSRGILLNKYVRDATLSLHEIDSAHIDFLNGKILQFVNDPQFASLAASSSQLV